MHRYAALKSVQMAPFWHGVLTHSVTSMSQFPTCEMSPLAVLSLIAQCSLYTAMWPYTHQPFANLSSQQVALDSEQLKKADEELGRVRDLSGCPGLLTYLAQTPAPPVFEKLATFRTHMVWYPIYFFCATYISMEHFTLATFRNLRVWPQSSTKGKGEIISSVPSDFPVEDGDHAHTLKDRPVSKPIFLCCIDCSMPFQS